MLRILLAEDHNIVRNGIRMLLEADEHITIAAEATNGLEVLTILETGIEVDIVLADINMPEMDGLALIKELKTKFPHILVIILSMHDNEKYITQAFNEGASAYLLKSVSADELLFTLRHIHSGGKYLCSELTMKLLGKLLSDRNLTGETSHVDFSIREIEVLKLIAEGMTNLEMADKLFISKRTVEGHRQSLIEKTGARNTAALIRYAVVHG
ncbi:MAG: response regulator transcription factor, partial [Sphingobacteriales bacterium]